MPSADQHNDFEYELDWNPRYFVLVTGPYTTMICMCQGLHWCVDYPMKEKIMLDKALKLEEVAILAFSLFVRNVFVQNAGAEGK